MKPLISHPSLLAVFLFLLLPPLPLFAAEEPARVVTVYLVTAYDYEPGPSSENPTIGKSLCATRCNAFSGDYLNYTEAGGWRVMRTATNQQIRLDPGNPFLDGRCLCTADQYQVRLNEVSYPGRSVLGTKDEK